MFLETAPPLDDEDDSTAPPPRNWRTDLGSELWFDDLLARLPVNAAEKARLCRTMRSADRHYHGVACLAGLWMRHQGKSAAKWGGLDTLIACAIAYHCCVSVGGDDAKQSAQEWLRASEASSLSGEERLWVAKAILATRSPRFSAGARADDSARARTWFLDLRRAPLADAPDLFDRHVRALRRESPDVSDADWARKRTKIFGRLLRAPIFQTPVLARVYEAKARANILRTLNAGN